MYHQFIATRCIRCGCDDHSIGEPQTCDEAIDDPQPLSWSSDDPHHIFEGDKVHALVEDPEPWIQYVEKESLDEM